MRSNLRLIISFVALFTLILSCTEEKKHVKFIARVEDRFLTEEQLNILMDHSPNRTKEEVVQEWISSELFRARATEEGLFKNEKFIVDVDNSVKKLAEAELLKNYFNSENISVSDIELKRYFIEYKSDFALASKAYVLNMASFKDRESAIDFRARALNSSWDAVSGAEKNNSSLIKLINKKLFFRIDLDLSGFVNVIDELYPDEVSIVLKPEPGKFVVVQLIKKYRKGDIPAFDYQYEKVKNLFLAVKRKELYNRFVQNLNQSYEVEIFGEE